MQCPLLTLQAVGKFCRGGKAMNEPSANPFFVVLLFILRCLVPLAILFGVSYLLRRMGLVAVEAPEPKEEEETVEKPTKDSDKAASSPKLTSATQSKKPKKKKVSPPRKKTTGKKPATKTKTGTTRSRSK
jgi:outer membrane biosynthesis protein TonB